MKFQFRFEVLLTLRKRELDEAGASVGKVHQAIAKIDAEMNEVNRERAALKASTALQSAAARPAIDHLLNSGRYDLQLQSDHQGLVETKVRLQQELDRRLVLLREAEWEVKRLEQLFEKDRDAFDEVQMKREQAVIDEAAARSHQRKSTW